MRKLGIPAIFFLVAGSGAAAAAEEPGNWTGFNLGLAGGLNSMQTDWKTTELVPGSSVGPIPLVAADMPQYDYKIHSGHIGAFAGYDYQIGSEFVVGVVGDIFGDFGSADSKYIPGTATHLSGGPGNLPTDDRVKISSLWDSSVRLRGGVLVAPNALFFASAGWAGAEREVKVRCTLTAAANTWCFNTAGNQRTKVSETLSGWTVGVGFEGLLARHWSVRFEYRYTDYGSDTQTFLTEGVPVANEDAVKADLGTTAHAVNLGLAYRF